MNIGIYIDNIGNEDQMKEIFDCVNDCLSNTKISDISVFYDNVGPCPLNVRCGFFNSTDLWNFNGTLITTSIDTTKSALSIVNNIKIYLQYKAETKADLFDLLKITNSDIDLLTKNEDDTKELFRLTGKQSKFTGSLTELLHFIGDDNG